ncbi:MAG: class III extradiol ring-cleavage dioxygenase [Pseudomonadota bacterium]
MPSTPIPSLFVSHGGPNVVIDPSEARDFLKGLADHVPAPSAILIMSAHFETDGVAVVTDPAPETLYDFGGFAPELREIQYQAPGDPELADKALSLLEEAGLAPQAIAKRGYDHGTWNPLFLGWPDADIPVVQVSIDPNRDAAWHWRVGEALAGLRDDGVLIIGSGHITHNLRAVFSAMRSDLPTDPEMARKVDAFIAWISEQIDKGDAEALKAWTERAPFVADNHPTDEHLMPLFFALGAAGGTWRADHLHASRQFGFFAWDSWAFHAA